MEPDVCSPPNPFDDVPVDQVLAEIAASGLPHAKLEAAASLVYLYLHSGSPDCRLLVVRLWEILRHV